MRHRMANWAVALISAAVVLGIVIVALVQSGG